MTAVPIASFYRPSIALRPLPLGVAHAIRGGRGTMLISPVGVVVFRQTLDLSAGWWWC